MPPQNYVTREMMAMDLGTPLAVVYRLIAKLGIQPVETTERKGWRNAKSFYAEETTAKLRAAPASYRMRST
jgi:hypothetical protein